MTHEIIVRKATGLDMPSLLIFEQGVIAAERPYDSTLQPGHINYYNLELMIAAEHIELLVAEIDGRLIGSGYARIDPARQHYLQHNEHAYLGFMYTEPAHRGKGVNKMIIEALKSWAAARNITELRLEVYSDNAPAIKAYEKAGFSRLLIEMRMSSGA